MTTSFWPRQPRQGDNAIGQFVIGVSPIGTIPAFDWHSTVISQYANSPTLLTIIDNLFQCIDPTRALDDFFSLIWNLDTAEGYGLDVWGRIVGVSRVLKLDAGDYLGYEEMGNPPAEPFNQAPFFNGTPATENYYLSDRDYRRLILAKAMSNITDGSIPSLNIMLMFLFGGPPFRGNAYVTDDGSMTMTYTFEFIPTPLELAIVQQSGVLPKSTGVAVAVVTPP